MSELNTGTEKIQQICQQIRYETLEPAKHEAEEIIRRADTQAQQIVRHAEIEAQKILDVTKQNVENEKKLLLTSMQQGCKQALAALQQEIEHALFRPALAELIDSTSQDPNVIARLIEALLGAIERQGTNAQLSAIIPQTVSTDAVNRLLAEKIVERLKEKSVIIGGFKGGAQVRWHDKHLVLDLSDTALKELVAQYINKDFHYLLFSH